MIAPPLPPDRRLPDRAPIPQLHQLTGLRGIAAWFVVFYHVRIATIALFPAEVIDVFDRGYLAVDLFFMLSGFVMWLNYGARLRAEGFAGAPAFWWKRIARIWPLHMAVLGAMALFVGVLIATGRPFDKYPLAELPLHILLLQNWGFTTELAWNHPAWSISTELGAYVVFPAMVLACRWERLRLPVLLGIAAILLATLYGLFAALGHDRLTADIPGLGLWRCLLGFSVGAVIALVWQRLSARGTGALLPAICGATALVAGFALGLPETAFAPAVFACALLALALDGSFISRVLASRPLRWLGDISYATYLTHFFLFILFKIAVVGEDGQVSAGELAAFFALVLAVSAAAFHGFEKPAQRWMNARRPRIFGGTPARAPN